MRGKRGRYAEGAAQSALRGRRTTRGLVGSSPPHPPLSEATLSEAPPPVLDGIASLVDKSLLRHETASESEPRYAMLEVIREFGLERLAASEVPLPTSDC